MPTPWYSSGAGIIDFSSLKTFTERESKQFSYLDISSAVKRRIAIEELKQNCTNTPHINLSPTSALVFLWYITKNTKHCTPSHHISGTVELLEPCRMATHKLFRHVHWEVKSWSPNNNITQLKSSTCNTVLLLGIKISLLEFGFSHITWKVQNRQFLEPGRAQNQIKEYSEPVARKRVNDIRRKDDHYIFWLEIGKKPLVLGHGEWYYSVSLLSVLLLQFEEFQNSDSCQMPNKKLQVSSGNGIKFTELLHKCYSYTLLNSAMAPDVRS